MGLGVYVGAVFVEHFHTTPQDAILNCVAAIGVFLAAERDRVEVLWWFYLSLAVFTLFNALVATSTAETVVTRAAFRWSTRFGRVMVLGGLALLIEFARRVAVLESDAWIYGVGVVVLVLTVSGRWYQALRPNPSLQRSILLDAIGPSMWLVDRAPADTAPGQVRQLRLGDQLIDHLVGYTLPSMSGRRAVLVPVDGGAVLTPRTLPVSVVMGPVKETSNLVGVVGANSTSQVLTFDQGQEVVIGDTLRVSVGGLEALFQVVDTRLDTVTWNGSRQLIPRATAAQIGAVDEGHLRIVTRLPSPHARVLRWVGGTTPQLGSNYFRVGELPDCEIPIGVARSCDVRGHLAVLGMTGMGKTTAVRRLCTALAAEFPVFAVDNTAEYRAKANWPPFDPTNVDSPGLFTMEPAGELANAGASFVAGCLARGKSEYENGRRVERVVAFEEAHGIFPEGNIADWDQKKLVGESTRDIMQARKYALSFIFVSQRTAVISKSALSQCESYIVFRTLDDTSLSYLEAIAGPIVRSAVPRLRRYEALCFGPAFNAENPVVVRLDPEL